MALEKQIEQISLESPSFSSGNAESGSRYDLKITDFDLDISPEFYGGNAYDKAISGKLRQNLRGVRPSVSISYNTSTESLLFFSLINDVIAAFVTDRVDSVSFYPDSSKTDSFEVVLESGLNLLTSYKSTVGNFKPSVELVSLNHITTIPNYLIAP